MSHKYSWKSSYLNVSIEVRGWILVRRNHRRWKTKFAFARCLVFSSCTGTVPPGVAMGTSNFSGFFLRHFNCFRCCFLESPCSLNFSKPSVSELLSPPALCSYGLLFKPMAVAVGPNVRVLTGPFVIGQPFWLLKCRSKVWIWLIQILGVLSNGLWFKSSKVDYIA